MKKIIIIFICLSQTINILAQEIQFTEGTWQSIKEKASIDNKIIMVDVYTDWCGPCKWMAKEVFTNDTAASFYNANFLCWQVDAEKGDGIDFAKEYDVKAYPTILFIDENGKMLHKSVGAVNATKLKDIGEKALNPESRLSALQEKYETGDRDMVFLSSYLKTLRAAFLPTNIIAIEYFALQDQDKWVSKESFDIINNYLFSTDNAVFEYFLQNKIRYSELIDSEKINQKIENMCYNEIYNNSKNWTENDLLSYFKKLESKGAYFSDKFKLDVKLDFYEIKKDWSKYASTAAELIDKKYLEYSDKKTTSMLLNNIAYKIFLNIDDKKSLKKALKWAKKSVELDENYYNLDTYGSLFYKLGDKKNAIMYCEKAINKAKETGDDSTPTQKILEDIKKMK